MSPGSARARSWKTTPLRPPARAPPAEYGQRHGARGLFGGAAAAGRGQAVEREVPAPRRKGVLAGRGGRRRARARARSSQTAPSASARASASDGEPPAEGHRRARYNAPLAGDPPRWTSPISISPAPAPASPRSSRRAGGASSTPTPSSSAPRCGSSRRRFAAYLEVPACAAVANGTDALVLALRALGLRPGDEVLVPAFSFFATAEAVVLLGGRPVFCDVDPETLNLDPARRRGAGDAAHRRHHRRPPLRPAVRRRRDPRRSASGTASGCSRTRPRRTARGSTGRRVGGFGRLAAWSFYPTKNLGCFGDGGAVTGSDRELVERVRRLANHGQTSRYHHVEVGTNSRLDSLQAAVLNCRLPLLDEDNARRRELACRYHGGLAGVGDLRLLPDPPGSVSVYHQLTVRTARRDELMAAPHGARRRLGGPLPLAAPPPARPGRPDPRPRRAAGRHRRRARGALPADVPRADRRARSRRSARRSSSFFD